MALSSWSVLRFFYCKLVRRFPDAFFPQNVAGGIEGQAWALQYVGAGSVYSSLPIAQRKK